MTEDKKSGFTLTEMLVGMAIFSLILVAVSGIFVSAIRIQKRALVAEEISRETSYLLEYMSRALRMARKDDVGGVDCLGGNKKTNYEITPTGIKFRNYKDQCQEFYLDTTTYQLIEKISSSGGELISTSTLTSPNLRVNYFYVNIFGAEQGDNQQPRVTITMEITKRNVSQPKVRVQTTISQRQLDWSF
ncbi:type II secretion system protein [bacterium]|nr:type II secretion system protein [bacterium]